MQTAIPKRGNVSEYSGAVADGTADRAVSLQGVIAAMTGDTGTMPATSGMDLAGVNGWIRVSTANLVEHSISRMEIARREIRWIVW